MSWVLVGDALHPHKVGTWSSLSLPSPSEILLVFHGWQFPPMCLFAHPRCFSVWRRLGLWENGRLWRKVYTGKQRAESFEPSQCIGLCGYCLKCVCSSLVSISFFFFWPQIFYCYIWMVMILLIFGLSERSYCSASLAYRPNSFHVSWYFLRLKSVC